MANINAIYNLDNKPQIKPQDLSNPFSNQSSKPLENDKQEESPSMNQYIQDFISHFSNKTPQVGNKKPDLFEKTILNQIVPNEVSSSSTSSQYKQLCDQLARKGKQFTDKDFPPEKCSISAPDKYNEYKNVVAWKRAAEILKNPDLYVDKIEPDDILQGNHGDCYLLSTFAALAEYPERIRKIFISKEYSKNSIYAISIVWRGANREVIIDDYLPVDSKDKPYFLITRGSELWVALLEKAWAKLHKNYDRIDGQLSKEALHDFTGAPVRSYSTDNKQDILWKRIVEADKKGYIMTSGTYDKGDGNLLHSIRLEGLVAGHAYTLIGAYEVELNDNSVVRLVQVRNPWGNFEWKGIWSDNDSSWNKVSAAEKKRIGYVGSKDDGSFFLEYSTLIKYYDRIQICYYQNGFVYRGLEVRSSATESKYFEIKIRKTGPYYFNISQLSIRLFDDEYIEKREHYSEAKFCIVDINKKPIQAFYGKMRDLYSCKYIENPFEFQAGTYLAFIQVKWLKSATHKFGFGAYGPEEVQIKEISKAEIGSFSQIIAEEQKNYIVSFRPEEVSQI